MSPIRVAVVSSAKRDGRCLSARRYLDRCETCDRVKVCDYGSPSIRGRLRLAQAKRDKAEGRAESARRECAALEIELSEAVRKESGE